MPIENNGQKFYTPSEVAGILNISVGMLRYLRNERRIEGTELGTITLYTEEQIRDADLSPRKRGPRTAKKNEEGDSGRIPSVMLTASLVGAA